MSSHATATRRVLGRYILGTAIGRGATSVVHRAHDVVADEAVAVKAIPIELDLGPRVEAEVRAAQRLDHSRIVALRDWGEDRECIYLVWDLVEGPSLSEVLRGGQRLDDGTALRIGEDVLLALAHAHGRGVVHRDVKPANILLDAANRAQLSDFGVARLSGESGLTMTGGVVGTVAYMAPEQARGGDVGPEADVYAACLVIHECLTGSNPIAAMSPAETARRAAGAEVPRLADVRPDLSPALCALIDTGLRRDPQQRPGAADLADGLSALIGGARATRLRTARALPTIASAVGGAGLAVLALTAGSSQVSSVTGFDGGSPGPMAIVIAASALAFAARPRAAALLALAAGALLIGQSSPGAAIALYAVGMAIVLSGWRLGRLTLGAAAGPLLFASGLGLLVPALAGLVPRWPGWLWAASASVATTVAWQIGSGTDSVLAGGGFTSSAVSDLADERSPVAVARRLWEPLAHRPEIGLQALALIVGALLVPVVVRARAGGPRVIMAAIWVAALGVALVATAADTANALGAAIPAAIVVIGWAVRPWRALGRGTPGGRSATLRGRTV